MEVSWSIIHFRAQIYGKRFFSLVAVVIEKERDVSFCRSDIEKGSISIYQNRQKKSKNDDSSYNSRPTVYSRTNVGNTQYARKTKVRVI